MFEKVGKTKNRDVNVKFRQCLKVKSGHSKVGV
jgi:hypothetical protein